MKVRVLQADNREIIYYLALTKNVNENACNLLNYNYTFMRIEDNYTRHIGMHPAVAKILVVNEYLQTTDDDMLIFLDTDAWIQNPKYLHKMVIKCWKDETKQGCYSRDTYVCKNTYINSGGFILKVNEYTKRMYREIIASLSVNKYYHTNWPFDQYFISNFVFANRNDFLIFKPEILNTPEGVVIRHNWNKDRKMYNDLYTILNNDKYDFNAAIDTEEYPNKTDGYDYITRWPPQDMPPNIR